MPSLLRTHITLRTLSCLTAILLAACQTTGPTSSKPPTGVSPRAVPQASIPTLPARAGFTCCNLHYEGDWISDANWTALPFIPVGTPIKLIRAERNRLIVEINGNLMRIGLDYGREKLSLEKYAEQVIVQQDPKATFSKWPDNIQQAIKVGKAAIGMTREQAIAAIGYPQADQTSSLSNPIWNYWSSSFGQYTLHWDKSGKLSKVESDPVTLAKVLFKGR